MRKLRVEGLNAPYYFPRLQNGTGRKYIFTLLSDKPLTTASGE